MAAHWSVVDYHTSLPSVTLSRASHSAVVWEDSMIVYGGYEFPSQGYSHSFVRKTNKSDPLPLGNVEGDVIRYLFGSRVWEVVNTSAAEYRELVVEDEGSGSGRNGNDTVVTLIPYLPAPRYGHSAVVVNVSCCTGRGRGGAKSYLCVCIFPSTSMFVFSLRILCLYFPLGFYVCIWWHSISI